MKWWVRRLRWRRTHFYVLKSQKTIKYFKKIPINTLTGTEKSFKMAVSKETERTNYKKECGHRKIRKRFSEHRAGRCRHTDPVLSAARTAAAEGWAEGTSLSGDVSDAVKGNSHGGESEFPVVLLKGVTEFYEPDNCIWVKAPCWYRYVRCGVFRCFEEMDVEYADFFSYNQNCDTCFRKIWELGVWEC